MALTPIVSTAPGAFVEMPDGAPSGLAASDVDYGGNVSSRLTPGKSFQVFSLLDAALERFYMSDPRPDGPAQAVAEGRGPSFARTEMPFYDGLMRPGLSYDVFPGRRYALDTTRPLWQIVWTVLHAWVDALDIDSLLRGVFGSYGSRWLWERTGSTAVTDSSFTSAWTEYAAGSSASTKDDFSRLALAWPILDMAPADGDYFTGRLEGFWPDNWASTVDDPPAGDFFNRVGQNWPPDDGSANSLRDAYEALRGEMPAVSSRRAMVESRLADIQGEASEALEHLKDAKGRYWTWTRRLDRRLLGLANLLMSATEWAYWHTWLPAVEITLTSFTRIRTRVVNSADIELTPRLDVSEDRMYVTFNGLSWGGPSDRTESFTEREETGGDSVMRLGEVRTGGLGGRASASSYDYGARSQFTVETGRVVDAMDAELAGRFPGAVLNGDVEPFMERDPRSADIRFGVAVDGTVTYRDGGGVERTEPFHARYSGSTAIADVRLVGGASIEFQRSSSGNVVPSIARDAPDADTSFLPWAYAQKVWVDVLKQVEAWKGEAASGKKIFRKGEASSRGGNGDIAGKGGMKSFLRTTMSGDLTDCIAEVAGGDPVDLDRRLDFDSDDESEISGMKSRLASADVECFLDMSPVIPFVAYLDASGRVESMHEKISSTVLEPFRSEIVCGSVYAEGHDGVTSRACYDAVTASAEAFIMCIVEMGWRNMKMAPQT